MVDLLGCVVDLDVEARLWMVLVSDQKSHDVLDCFLVPVSYSTCSTKLSKSVPYTLQAAPARVRLALTMFPPLAFTLLAL